VLTVDDVTNKYLLWLTDPVTSQHLLFNNAKLSIESVKEYVAYQQNQENIIFLGIFDKITNHHIGNIKFELRQNIQTAILGILIGCKEWQGKGVAPEVISSSGKWLKKNKKIKQLVLGVDPANVFALKSYRKAGFIVEEPTTTISVDPESLSMILLL
jgi:RimJ/RimL family protein N-acetyltransferase